MPERESGKGAASRRSVLKTSGLAVAAAGTAGCLGQLGGSGQSVTPVNDELTLWHAMGGGNGETLNALGDQFEAETGTSINMEFQDSYESVLTNFLGALESGEVPDFAQIDSLFAKQVLDRCRAPASRTGYLSGRSPAHRRIRAPRESSSGRSRSCPGTPC